MMTETQETVDVETEPVGRHARGAVSRISGPASLVVAVIAAILAIWALASRPPAPDAPPAPTARQSQESRARVCDVFNLVRTGVSVQSNASLGADAIAREAVAANARLASIGGGSYLLSSVDSATPPELAEAARSFATLLQGIGTRQLAGTPGTDPTLTSQMNEAQGVSTRITALCA